MYFLPQSTLLDDSHTYLQEIFQELLTLTWSSFLMLDATFALVIAGPPYDSSKDV